MNTTLAFLQTISKDLKTVLALLARMNHAAKTDITADMAKAAQTARKKMGTYPFGKVVLEIRVKEGLWMVYGTAHSSQLQSSVTYSTHVDFTDHSYLSQCVCDVVDVLADHIHDQLRREGSKSQKGAFND